MDILSRARSLMISRSNWENDSRTFKVRRPYVVEDLAQAFGVSWTVNDAERV